MHLIFIKTPTFWPVENCTLKKKNLRIAASHPQTAGGNVLGIKQTLIYDICKENILEQHKLLSQQLKFYESPESTLQNVVSKINWWIIINMIYY